ncbi:MAG TPA: hypothetical protein VGJ48_27330 [Pyrinomonadaceae bacterium]
MFRITSRIGAPFPQAVRREFLTRSTNARKRESDRNLSQVGSISSSSSHPLDQSFLLRAERAGGDSRGRTYMMTYTATDASGNQTQTSTTVHVPYSQ